MLSLINSETKTVYFCANMNDFLSTVFLSGIIYDDEYLLMSDGARNEHQEQ